MRTFALMSAALVFGAAAASAQRVDDETGVARAAVRAVADSLPRGVDVKLDASVLESPEDVATDVGLPLTLAGETLVCPERLPSTCRLEDADVLVVVEGVRIAAPDASAVITVRQTTESGRVPISTAEYEVFLVHDELQGWTVTRVELRSVD